MDQVFVARGTADAVPIWFVTAATYADVRARLDADARAFADAAGFEPKAGRHLLLPGKGGLGGVLFGIEANRRREGFIPARPPAAAVAGRRLPLRQRAARCAARRARRGARLLPLHALPQVGGPPGQARTVAKPRSRRAFAHCRSRDAGARPHQHAGERHGAGRSRSGGAEACRKSQCRHPRHRRRRSVGAKFPLDPRRRPRRGTDGRAAADRHGVGRRQASARDPGRQGRLLRYRRPRHQARHRHAQHEEGHGRRGDGFGAGAHDHGARVEGAAARAHSGGGEFDRRRKLPPARHLHLAQRNFGRDRQYRRRRPAHPRRRAGAGRRGEAGADRRFRHAHRRRARRARPGHAGLLHRR